MKHFRLRVIFTALLAAVFVAAFGWIGAWQNYRLLSREAAKEKPLNREAVKYTQDNLSASWTDYEQKVKRMYEVEALFASLALQSVKEVPEVPEEASQQNSIVLSIRDGKLSTEDPAVSALGLDASLFKRKQGSFQAPKQPSTFVAYSRIGDTSDYFVKWYENTVPEDIVREAVDIPGILRRTEITYDTPAIFVSCDPASGELSDILYKNSRYFSDCESLEDLGLTKKDLEQNNTEASGTLKFGETGFSYVSGASSLPQGYIILLEPVPDLYAKAFLQEGYMVAALIILVTALLVAGFSLYPFVRGKILTLEEEKKYEPAHIRSTVSLFGVFGLVIIAIFGMFSYSLNGLYDNVVRGRERLGMLEDSLSIHSERYSQSVQSLHDIYLDYGNLIGSFLDTYPQLRNPEVLSTLTDSIFASSITLYDSDGRETVSSGRWNGLVLGTDPASTTYDFRRILRGVPSIIHDPEIDEMTGQNEMRIGIQIRDDSSRDLYGVMMLCVDPQTLPTHDIDPERLSREILRNLSDTDTALWIADAAAGTVLVSGQEELEGKNISGLGLDESELKDALVKVQSTEEGNFLVTSAAMETPGILEWTGAAEGIIAYYRGPEISFLAGMLSLVAVGCITYLVIYFILAKLVLAGYTEEFFRKYKNVEYVDDTKKKPGLVRRIWDSVSPGRKGLAAMEIATGVILLQVVFIVNSRSSLARSTVYYYISEGTWEKGFNLFSVAAIVILLAKLTLIVIGLRLLMRLLATFTESRGKTLFRLIANIILYIALIFFLIRMLEYLGFSPTAILAGMGSVALAISLGAQNFVADIFAGMTIVFEGTVHVGDNVQIEVVGGAPCHGRVEEVGIRCIKLLTREGDCISFSNRDVRTIRNRTQMNSSVICELTVSSEIPAEDLEQMLKAELPEISREDRQILSGPIYNGVISISNGKMTLSVSAECREEDFFYVRHKLFVSLQRIFKEHGYSL